MTVLERINDVRRKMMNKLTQKVGNSTSRIGKIDHPVEVKRVLISRPNHRLGNLLLITPLVQEVTETFPNCKIDLFVKGGLGPVIFKNYGNVDKIIQLPKKHFKHLYQYFRSWTLLRSKEYDLVINVVKTSSSGRLSTKFTNANNKFFGEIEEGTLNGAQNYSHIAKYPVYNFRKALDQSGLSVNHTKEVPTLNLKLNNRELAEGKKTLEALVPKEITTICLFTYATGTKLYPKEWWSQFHQTLVKEFPTYNFLEVLPVENVSQIDFKEPSFYSKDIREIGAVIANTAIFIGADSGIMHLANSVQTPTIGLFHSNPQFYSPYGNRSTGFNTSERSLEELIEEVKKILNVK